MVSILMNSELIELKEALIAKILAIEEIQFYLLVKEKFSQHQRLNELVAKQKTLQKELVNAKHIQKQHQVILLEEKLADIATELDETPLFQQFKSASEHAQETLDEISALINMELNINTLDEHME